MKDPKSVNKSYDEMFFYDEEGEQLTTQHIMEAYENGHFDTGYSENQGEG
ncbi:hypothetical protein [Priestia endophytica]|jgi:hypothetical protein|uniref:DUF4025 domain-containing protein n=1 Tax=Priestia endophytica DSM 13796 TaxID=1121089 RepID=A0A1I5WWV3_9BACI|nr:hypothetical protein [Priestia endophytica]MCM3539884.1 hypothetical protein [Priestia endophytica]SFQ24233.1 hypothetical protein SAMN02745910_00792 [Priestia endophytica DSM 13796]